LAYPIWIKFCTLVRDPDIITCANFGDDRLKGLEVAEWGSNFGILPIHSSSSLQTLGHFVMSVDVNVEGDGQLS